MSKAIAPHLPYLRRFARALAGTQAAGDAYVAALGSDGATAGPAIARFLHLRDYFNAQRLAEALGAHIAELAGGAAVTVLVVEAR